ncbi:DUF4344 domain-containing metallopeptidase [Thermostichus vulcanus]|uniref:DUF4344 domain-containing metallopeptidase n=1 Tax=Thermostichus vulcanus str. 'Rupite' TaxID=2813851 RepID=A0ABT0CD50_THEVL|nr:DUF4344 domain-containing metallopeptidase [Thermostichus vulcanus]MCJ2543690.1 DUF4344 domain-containing metallopeptidase [Thermostichus vulcanus str. 'Rupite']
MRSWLSRMVGGVLAGTLTWVGIPSLSLAQTIEDEGDLVLTYEATEDVELEAVRLILESNGTFDELIAGLNEEFAFPQDIQVVFTECGTVNAFYDPEVVQISMCYELIAYYAALFADENMSPEDLEAQVIDSGLFTFFHELGHALVDQYELPITGREEDVVDEFAVLSLLEYGSEGEWAAIVGMAQFAFDAAQEAEVGNLAYWGEHALSAQRFYSMACLIYGSNPEQFADLVGEDGLPEERATQCPYEYEQKYNSWTVLLDPYLK